MILWLYMKVITPKTFCSPCLSNCHSTTQSTAQQSGVNKTIIRSKARESKKKWTSKKGGECINQLIGLLLVWLSRFVFSLFSPLSLDQGSSSWCWCRGSWNVASETRQQKTKLSHKNWFLHFVLVLRIFIKQLLLALPGTEVESGWQTCKGIKLCSYLMAANRIEKQTGCIQAESSKSIHNLASARPSSSTLA